MVNGEAIPCVEQGIFIGITFDKKLSWSSKILELLNKMSRRLNVFIVLVTKNMDLKPSILINLFKSLIRRTIDNHYTAVLQSKSYLNSLLTA